MNSVSSKMGTRYYQGQFAGVWSHGKNIAPNGAAQVQIDTKTGAVISFR